MSDELWVGAALLGAFVAMWLACEIDLRVRRHHAVKAETRDDGWWWV